MDTWLKKPLGKASGHTLEAGGKPSTWFPPGKFAELLFAETFFVLFVFLIFVIMFSILSIIVSYFYFHICFSFYSFYVSAIYFCFLCFENKSKKYPICKFWFFSKLMFFSESNTSFCSKFSRKIQWEYSLHYSGSILLSIFYFFEILSFCNTQKRHVRMIVCAKMNFPEETTIFIW